MIPSSLRHPRSDNFVLVLVLRFVEDKQEGGKDARLESLMKISQILRQTGLSAPRWAADSTNADF